MMDPRIAIQCTNEMYQKSGSVTFFDSTTRIWFDVTTTGSVIQNWVRKTKFVNKNAYYSGNLTVGVSVEWDNTVDGSEQEPPTKLLSFFVQDRCLVVFLHKDYTFPNLVKTFMADEKITFVGLGCDLVESKLGLTSHGLNFNTLHDLRDFLEEVGLKKDADIREVRRRIMFKDLEAFALNGKWELPLGEQEIRYAVTYAYVCYAVGEKICVRNMYY